MRCVQYAANATDVGEMRLDGPRRDEQPGGRREHVPVSGPHEVGFQSVGFASALVAVTSIGLGPVGLAVLKSWS
jgi:hypothetical protein